MTIQRLDSGIVSLGPLNAVLCELLRLILPSAQDDHPAAQARLFPPPSGGSDDDLDADWKSYVEPDLRHIFQSSLEVIEQDLAALDQNPSGRRRDLRIPVSHLNAWIHGLNQARLALVARHRLTEAELEEHTAVDDEDRSFALLQTHFYGLLQHSFLHELGDR